ncbi:class I SAM-dependent methyltransferase [Mangrovimonas sp. DI 80]|uniref:THUMP-like domain-containing protein n=1 Tax=Mangrovimonas sp. DI 80 TaxID=1779330 RepID=UPI000977E493|nr:class I SAM-dependent methyltransferase [Mangrovimonas sp. DI 80]OMP30808.1 SAM-dependent methyltransferase [Mangrovimonas sp. DI 80]
MNPDILNTTHQEFIDANLNSDTAALLFKKHPEITVDIKLLVEQIEAKKRCQHKLPTWFNAPLIVYPNKLNIEQTSSEATAKYKAGLIEGKSLIDLTGGFGVDCYYFSKRIQNVTHCELNSELSEIVTHNYSQLNVNIKALNVDGIEHLKKHQDTYDWIYIDPSRRHDSKGKVFFLNDCLPNVPLHLDMLFQRSKNIMIKTSPLLDISVGMGELKHIKTIHIVALNNEVKELLWVLEDNFKGDIEIKTVNLTQATEEKFDFNFNVEKNASAVFSEPLSYLYEPNAAILKSGAFKSISEKLGVPKLHQHTHLYTSETLIEFPGRSFEIVKTIPFNKQLMKKEGISKANITTRNFPETVQQLRTKLKIKDGGELYLFFSTNLNDEKIVIFCKKTS